MGGKGSGGKRNGAGRPEKEPTKTISIRVPESRYSECKAAAKEAVNYILGNKKAAGKSTNQPPPLKSTDMN